MKTPWHSPSMGVARSYLWDPVSICIWQLMQHQILYFHPPHPSPKDWKFAFVPCVRIYLGNLYLGSFKVYWDKNIAHVCHVLNEDITGFELGPESIYGLIGPTEAPYCQIAIMFTNRLSIPTIYRCFAVPTRTHFSPRLEHGVFVFQELPVTSNKTKSNVTSI